MEVWLAKLSTGACLRRPKAIVVDTEGTQTICDKHGHGSCDLTSCLEVDQLLERTTSLILRSFHRVGVPTPDLDGVIKDGCGYDREGASSRGARTAGWQGSASFWALGGPEVQIGVRCLPATLRRLLTVLGAAQNVTGDAAIRGLSYERRTCSFN